ncbi:MAG: DUF1835 domain-containing protein [Gammaproteobacteria bacterium]|nr:DUF1835 domain-containing protein [Gammaproteobacteria bacterium]
MSILSITSNQANARAIQAAGPEVEVVACEDVLYEGPLQLGLSPEDLAKKRAMYFSACGMEGAKALSERYSQRFGILSGYHQHEQIVLWFSQNLYNQLLLIQLLHWIESQNTGRIEISLASPDRLPVSKNIQTFDSLNPDQIHTLYRRRVEISVNQLNTARAVWEAVCSDDPRDLAQFSKPDMRSLSFLPDAVQRLLQQYPAKINGLSRTEKQILEILNTGESDPEKVFIRVQRKEEYPFMNQVMFWLSVSRLIQADHPAIELQEEYNGQRVGQDNRQHPSSSHIRITDTGKRLLRNQDDWIQLNGIDRWVGGVHLNSKNIWRWDASHHNISRTYV